MCFSPGCHWRLARQCPLPKPSRHTGTPRGYPAARGTLRCWDTGCGGSRRSTPGRIRTCNQRIRNPLLYPLSYGRKQFNGNELHRHRYLHSGHNTPKTLRRRTESQPVLTLRNSGTNTRSLPCFILLARLMYRNVVVNDLCRIFRCKTGAGRESALRVAYPRRMLWKP